MNPENIQDLYTLTATQRAILFHTLFAPETGVYVEQSAFEMDDLDVPQLRAGVAAPACSATKHVPHRLLLGRGRRAAADRGPRR
jgi:hypothetical protein